MPARKGRLTLAGTLREHAAGVKKQNMPKHAVLGYGIAAKHCKSFMVGSLLMPAIKGRMALVGTLLEHAAGMTKQNMPKHAVLGYGTTSQHCISYMVGS